MLFLERKDDKAYKRSVNDSSLIFSNFLPIKNKNNFDEFVSFIQKNIDCGNGKDVSSLRQEKNGTLVLKFNNPDVYLKLYTNHKGYVRYNSEGIDRIINWDIKVNNEKHYFYGEVETINSIDEQLHRIVKYIIYNG